MRGINRFYSLIKRFFVDLILLLELNDYIMLRLKLHRLLLIFLFAITSLVAAEDKPVLPPMNFGQKDSIEKIENELISRGYVLCDQFFIDTFEEYDRFVRYYNGRKVEMYVVSRLRMARVIFHFVFFLKDYPNTTVGVDIVDENNKIIKQYLKVNVHEELPNLWLACDVNKDGVIEENEGHIAWW